MTMLTNEEAENLLKMPKWIVSKEIGHGPAHLPRCGVFLTPEQCENLPMMSEDGSHKFRLVINREKVLKLALQHDATNPRRVQLLRVEYGGKEHTNPSGIPTKKVPPLFRKHIGAVIPRGKAHVHRHVAGFLRLQWALPLLEDEFPVKTISDEGDVLNAVRAFGNAISMATKVHLVTRQ